MKVNYSRLAQILMVVGMIPTAFADDALKHDPFTRPLITAAKPENVAGTASTANIVEESPWNPTLTAVMVAGKNSLITLDGVIMKLDEEIEGYRLVQVKDHEAVFKKGKKRIVLTMQINTQKSLLRQKTEQVSP